MLSNQTRGAPTSPMDTPQSRLNAIEPGTAPGVPSTPPSIPDATELMFRGKRMRADRALIMAIINRTPDSFYDRGQTFADDTARAAIAAAVNEGADIVDIGGVKAGPGDDVDTAEELRRVIPIIEWARERYPELVISTDTWRHEVGSAACEAGADLINDTWAGADPVLADVAAHYGVGLVCSHTGGLAPRTRPHRVRYPDVLRTSSGRPLRWPSWSCAEVCRRTAF